MHRLRLLRRRRPAGADRPDRLVGHDDPRRRRAPSACDHRVELAPDDRFGAPGSRSASVSPTHDDRRQALRASAARRLRRHQLRRVSPWNCAALRMTDDHVAATELRQHRRRNFAGVRALRVLAHVLRAPRDRRCPSARPAPAPGTGTARIPPACRRPRRRHRTPGGRAAPRWRRARRSSSSCPTTSLRRMAVVRRAPDTRRVRWFLVVRRTRSAWISGPDAPIKT